MPKPIKVYRTSLPQVIPSMSLNASLLTVFVCTLFGANAVAIKIALTGLGIFTTAGIRFCLAATTIFFWARLTGKTLIITRSQAGRLVILSIIFVCQLGAFYLGMSHTTASHGTLIANLLPFVVLILAHFFIPGDRITPKKALGIGLGFTGVAILFLDNTTLVNGDLLLGDTIILCAVLIWGCNAIFVKRMLTDCNAFQITLYPMLLGGPVFLFSGFFLDGGMVTNLNLPVFLALMYQAFVTASFGFVVWTTMLQQFGATALHSFIFILPLAGVFFGVIILDDPLTPNIITAIALIVMGIIITHIHGKRQPSCSLGAFR